MPFDATVPQNHQPFNADIVRAQLNALNDKIDAQAGTIAGQAAQITDLQSQVTAAYVRIAALEPHGPVMVGCGDPLACGVYVQDGTYNGKPIYKNANGYTLAWNMTDMWQILNADPRSAMFQAFYVLSGASYIGAYTVWNGAAPGGTVS